MRRFDLSDLVRLVRPVRLALTWSDEPLHVVSHCTIVAGKEEHPWALELVVERS